MKICHFKLNYGFVLIDAMIAMVVVAVGLFGVAKLNSVMLAGTGIAKTRAMAIHLAEEKIEQCRMKRPPYTQPPNIKCDSSISAEQLEIKDADDKLLREFTREWKIVDLNASNKSKPAQLSVCVSWDPNPACCSWNASLSPCTSLSEEVKKNKLENKVELHTLLAWSDLGTGAAIGGGTNAPGGEMPKTPAGVAVEGGNNGDPYETLPSGTGVTINDDGTRIYEKSEKVTELIDDSTKLVLLTISDGSDFSSVTGKVYIAWGSDVDKKDESDITLAVINEFVSVLGSGGSACKQFISGGGETLLRYPTSGDTEFSYFNYTCYMGAGWYGNIAVVRFDGGDRVCIGDPNVPQSDVTPTSRRPRLSTNRMYRGYSCTNLADPSTCSSIGMGMADGDYQPQIYGMPITVRQHHFLLTTINGNPADGECAPNLGLPSLTTNPFTSLIDPINRSTNAGNAGYQFCMTSTCPIPGGFITYLTNFVLRVNSVAPTPPVVMVDGGVCSNSVTTTAPFIYNCQINWIGWAGDYWVGNLHFTSDGELPIAGTLSTPAVSAIDPEDGIVTAGLGCIDLSESASTCPIDGIGCVYKCIDFTKVDKNVTSFDITVTAP